MLLKHFLDHYSSSRDINSSIIRTFAYTEHKLNRTLNENKYSFDINLSGMSATFIGKKALIPVVSATDIHIGNLGDFFVAVVNYKKEKIEFEDLSSTRNFYDKSEILRIYRSGGEIIKYQNQSFLNLRGYLLCFGVIKDGSTR